MVSELYCPTCHTELMIHEASRCLNYWVFSTAWNLPDYRQGEERLAPPYSTAIEMAWALMEKVWEMDLTAEILRDRICVNWLVEDLYEQSFKGESFPLNVCRVFLWLKNREKDHVAV